MARGNRESTPESPIPGCSINLEASFPAVAQSSPNCQTAIAIVHLVGANVAAVVESTGDTRVIGRQIKTDERRLRRTGECGSAQNQAVGAVVETQVLGQDCQKVRAGRAMRSPGGQRLTTQAGSTSAATTW